VPAAAAPVAAPAAAPAPPPAAAPAAPAPAAAAPAPSEAAAPAPATEEEPKEDELTEEEKKQKARAERFGIPWVRQKKPAAAAPAAPKEKPAAPKAEEKEKPAKPAAIDATPLGISPEVLARRAAKFGLPEKKASPITSPAKDEKKELSAYVQPGLQSDMR
jgi:SAP domain-containing ribonucleoprotein